MDHRNVGLRLAPVVVWLCMAALGCTPGESARPADAGTDSTPRSPRRQQETKTERADAAPDAGAQRLAKSDAGAADAAVQRPAKRDAGAADAALAPSKADPPGAPLDAGRKLCEKGWKIFKAGDTAAAGSEIRAGLKLIDPLRPKLSTGDGATLAACLYNLGRVHEEQGDARLAIAQYGRSLALRPHKGIESRLRKLAREQGVTKCKLDLSSGRLESRVAASWVELAGALLKIHDQPNTPPPPTTAIEARILLCSALGEPTPCPEDRPSDLVIKTEHLETHHIVAPRPDGSILYLPRLAEWMGGRCASEGAAKIVTHAPLHVVSVSSHNSWEFTDENGRQCSGGIADGCYSGCFWSRHAVEHHFIDVATGRSKTLSATFGTGNRVDIPAFEVFQVEQLGSSLHVYGCGARRTIPWSTGP